MSYIAGCKAVIFNENGKQLVSSYRKRPPPKELASFWQ